MSSCLQKMTFANTNQDFFGSSSAFGDARSVFGSCVANAASTQQTSTWQASNVGVGSFGNDYITQYSWTANEVDILVGGGGTDIFVAGDRFGPHYLGSAISIVADYNLRQGDMVQLAASGAGGYTYRTGSILGGRALDTVLYYNNDPIMVLVDASTFKFTYA
jgi:hypothetical protein